MEVGYNMGMDCCGCHIEERNQAIVHPCPHCNQEGISVNKITVEHLVMDEFRSEIKEEEYWICMNEDCDMVYYPSENRTYFLIDQINVSIGFKKDAEPKYACYCSKVTEEEVLEAVLKHGATTVKEVNALTGAMKDCHCIENNPLGICCHKTIQDGIDKALSMLKK